MEAIPSEIANLVGGSHLQGHALLLAIPTDIDEVGRAGEQWLLVTERECAVAIPGDPEHGTSARCIRTFLFEHIDACRAHTEVGSGYLQVSRGNVWIDLLRFSNRLTSQFREIAAKLEHLRKHRDFVVDPADESGAAPAGDKLPTGTDEVPRHAIPLFPTLRRVFLLIWPFRSKAAIIAGLSIVTVVIELAPPWLQMILVDNILGGKGAIPHWGSVTLSLALIVASLLVIRLVAALIAVWKANLSSQVGTRLTADLRQQMVDKLQRLSIAYHDRNQVGMLMSRVSYDTEAMHTFIHQFSGGFFLQILQLVAIGITLFALNPRLAFFTLLPMPLAIFASWFFCRHLYARNHRYWDMVGHQATALSSLLSGIRVVKSFTQEPREQARFQDTSERLRASRLSLDLANATFSSLIGFLFGLGGLVVWYVGGQSVLAHEMSLGSLMAFLAYLSMFYAPLTTITEGASWLSSFLAASHRIFDLLDTPVSVAEPESPRKIEQLRGNIRFNEVTFSYDDQKPALDNVSFEVRQGESIGIVGRSGSGKSTIINLISRLYDIDSGEITIDGVDVRQINSAILRRQVGMVLQEPFLFGGTVASNIAYGDPDAAAEKIISSAKAAGAHDFILRMPFGYETILGEGGTGLSGGERQRLSIARAILYDPQILILDEATSSIDSESEHLIQRAVERFSQGRTMIAIAHRLSTLEGADRLLVMDQGRLAEQGTDRELLAAGGIYSRLKQLQFGATALSGQLAVATVGEGPDETAGDSQDGIACAATADGTQRDNELTWEVRWLAPDAAEFFVGLHEILSLRDAGREFAGIYMVRSFPATHSDEFLSIRYEDENGRDRELGMLRRLSDWPDSSQELIRRSLNRRYLLRTLKSIVSFREDNGFVKCVADTDDGRADFVVHSNVNSVKKFGYNGRLLTDLDQNHYIIHDIEELPFLQRRLFQRLFPEL